MGCVAMDEFHFYGDPQRGWAWQVPLLTLPQTQFLLMSATLGDVTQIVDTLKRHTDAEVDVIADAPRPVPLSYEYVKTPLEATVELAIRAKETPLYIVHFSQDAALDTAQSLATTAWPPRNSARLSSRPLRALASPRRSARRSSVCWAAAWACTTRACCRVTVYLWKSSPSRAFFP